jgi:acyl-CoA synthetase (NDP forming)
VLDKRLLDPAGIAVVGASDDPAKLAGRPVRYLKELGYQGAIVPVHPAGGTVQGLPALRSLAEAAPGTIDICVVMVGAELVPGVLADVAAAGIPYAVVVAAGFGEAGRPDLDDAVRAALAGSRTRLVGPNCVGLVVPATSVAASFASTLRTGMYAEGGVTLLTQSGAIGNSVVQALTGRGLGIRMWASTGNELDIDVLELAEFVADDAATRVVGMFVEGFQAGRGERFVEVGRRLHEAGKPLVVLRGATTESGRRMSASHTGKIGTTEAVWRGIARQARAIPATSPLELVVALEATSVGGLPVNDGLAVASISGGMAVVISDMAWRRGVRLAGLSDTTAAAVQQALGLASPVTNPIDMSLAPTDKALSCVAALAADDGVGHVLVVLSSLAHDYDEIARRLPAVAAEITAAGRRLYVTYLADTDRLPQPAEADARKAGAVVTADPALAVLAVAAVEAARTRATEAA